MALDGAASEIRNSMEGFAGRLGMLGGALAALGPAGVAAGAAIATMGAGLVRGIQDAGAAEQAYRRLEAVLSATGHAAGLTGRQITAFAEEMERSTLVTAEGVQEAAAVLATFRSISGETFTRTLALAQDMATVFGGSLSSSATQLGKAFEDPIQGLSALRRVGVSFSGSQRDLIQSLMDTGREAEAQRVILDALEKQIGGAAAAEAKGLTGATNRLSDAWGNFLEELANTTGAASIAEGALMGVARVMERVSEWLRGGELDERIATLQTNVTRLRERVENFGGPLGDLFGMEAPGPLKQVLADQEAELAALQRQRDEAAAKAKSEEEKAEAGRKAAAAARAAERLAALRAEAEKEIQQYATDAEKRAATDKNYDDKRRQIEALRTADNTKEIDAALGRETELHRRRIAQLDAAEAKRGAADARRQAAAHKAAAREAARNAEVIEQVGRQLASVADERQQFIDQALSRLSEAATAAQRAEVERLAGALYDQKEAQEAKAKAEREGLRLTEGLLSPAEEYETTLGRITELLAAEAITQETANRARAQAALDFADAEDSLLRQSRAWRDGAQVALGDYLDEATNAAQAAEEVTVMAFGRMEDALTSMVTKGKLDFAGLADSIVEDITRIAIKQAILAPLAEGLFGGMGGGGAGAAGEAASQAGGGWLGGMAKGAGSWLASWFHEGGVVGESTAPRRMVDAALFLNAPRYHAGGRIGGLAPDEIPAILQRGEVVLSRRQVAERTQAPVNVIMNITTPDASSFRASQGQITADAARAIERAQRRHL
jgi:lambda family phage tail tape measure protein